MSKPARRPILTLNHAAKSTPLPPPAPQPPAAKPSPRPASPPIGKHPPSPPPKPRTAGVSLSKPAHALREARITKAAALARKHRFREAEVAILAAAPALFDPAAPKPLAIGIDKLLRSQLGLTLRQVSYFLSHWTRRDRYLRALAAGGPRYGLDGAECGVVEDRAIAHAQAELTRRAGDQAA